LRNSIRFIFLFLLVAVSACSNRREHKVLKLAHALDVNHSVHKAMIKMAESVNEKSKGKLQIQIYPNQQLGSERELLELIQLGAIDITKTSAAVVEGFDPAYRLFGFPYLFKSDQHMRNTLDGEIGESILNGSIPFRFRGLVFYDSGKRSFYTSTKKISNPEDLAGLNIRVQASNLAIQLIQQFDAAATPIPFGDLYTALQQGVVDGAENNPPAIYLTRHYEVCSYLILDEHTTVPDVLMISETSWQSLNKDEQTWIKEASILSREYQIKLWKESENEVLQAMQMKGLEIIKPDKNAFKEKVRPLTESMLQDKSLKQLYDKVQAHE